jgi:hypothetical protein
LTSGLSGANGVGDALNLTNWIDGLVAVEAILTWLAVGLTNLGGLSSVFALKWMDDEGWAFIANFACISLDIVGWRWNV